MPTKRDILFLIAFCVIGAAAVFVTSSGYNNSNPRVTFNRTPEIMDSQGELLLCAESSDPQLSKEAEFRSSAGSWSRVSRSSYRNSTLIDGEVTFIPVKAGPRCRFYRPSPVYSRKPYTVVLKLVVKNRVEQEIHVNVLADPY